MYGPCFYSLSDLFYYFFSAGENLSDSISILASFIFLLKNIYLRDKFNCVDARVYH